ncbi:twin-arginine translocase TatA/TatE family subunit [Haloarchaeobius litoreus]|uniref:Sec-independent protein translocase protein TatA n=1 Tax=Haloarchaeobius litoreus TaxID=755306 RepID=A0ABD6DGT6_9EURY|nr:twin-arginine translocase TatA/TatE family subunit [Haloarchaeobius litoreus]
MALATTPLFVGGLGAPEVVLIFLVVVLLFGANKIPKIARSTGEAMGEFQKGREEVEQELEEIRDGTKVDTGSSSTGSASSDATVEPDPIDTESETETETETDSDSK